jgi:prepilin-type N-terminal cleavage/methylation domain-containing protein
VPSRPQAGFTLIELLVVVAIVAVLASISMAAYRHSRVRASEAAAVTALEAINQAQFSFMQTCGKQRYAPTLVALGTPVPGDDHGFISGDLAVSDPLQKSEYIFALSGTPASDGELTCNGLTPLESYRLTADPVAPGMTGTTFFGTNSDRVIYADTASFAADMPETGAPGHGAEIR